MNLLQVFSRLTKRGLFYHSRQNMLDRNLLGYNSYPEGGGGGGWRDIFFHEKTGQFESFVTEHGL